MSEERFERSPTPFFDYSPVRKLLAEIAQSKNLVIYGGAGVTIDRTGLGWTDLIAAIFPPQAEYGDEYPSLGEISLLAKKLDSAHFASVMVRHAMDQNAKVRDLQNDLVPHLTQVLYKNNGWQSGRLAHNIANLATYSAQIGKDVSVFTTNYDVYIEDAIDRSLREMQATNSTKAVPRLRVRLVGNTSHLRGKNASEPFVNMTYLHGRVRKQGGHDGRLVISELDYAQTRAAVVGELIEAFDREDTSVLILGASLTDAPLTEALAHTSHRGRRCAVVPISSIGFTDQTPDATARLTTQSLRRPELLGVKVLSADFKYQVAQFCEEALLTSTYPAGPESALSPEARVRYGLRLCDWWEAWKSGQIASDPTVLHEELVSSLTQITTLVQEGTSDSKKLSTADERFRLELWVRRNPKSSERELVLWGTSSGPLIDRDVLRSYRLSLQSGNAAVEAFIEGRPQHFDATDLRKSRSSSHDRWHSFLSAPIYVESDAGIRLPAGVVTLASTKDKSQSALPLRDVNTMEDLIEKIKQCGGTLLAAPI